MAEGEADHELLSEQLIVIGDLLEELFGIEEDSVDASELARADDDHG